MRTRATLGLLTVVAIGLVVVIAVALRPAPVAAPAATPTPLSAASPTATVAASTASPIATSAPSPSATARPSPPLATVTWKRVTSTPAGAARVRDIHAVAGGPFIAVGHAEGVHAELRSYVWTSQDGVTWRLVPDDPVLMGLALSAVGPAPGGGVVAVGRGLEGNRVLRSTDGTSWRKVADLEGRDDNVSTVTQWGGGILLTGTTAHGPALKGVVWTSADGERFTRSPDADHFAQATITDVAVHRDRLVGVGYVVTPQGQGGMLPRAAVWTSADGKTWSPVTGDGFANAQMEGVVASDRGLVAVGSSSDPRGQAAWTSTDGVTWKRVAHGPPFAPGLAPGSMRDLVLVPGGYVAVGNTGGPNDVMIWTSPDGITWARAELEPALRSASIDAVATNGSRVVAGGVAGDRSIAFWYSPP